MIPLERGDYLRRLAAVARHCGLLRLGGPLPLGAFLTAVAFLFALAVAGALGGLCGDGRERGDNEPAAPETGGASLKDSHPV